MVIPGLTTKQTNKASLALLRERREGVDARVAPEDTTHFFKVPSDMRTAFISMISAATTKRAADLAYAKTYYAMICVDAGVKMSTELQQQFVNAKTIGEVERIKSSHFKFDYDDEFELKKEECEIKIYHM